MGISFFGRWVREGWKGFEFLVLGMRINFWVWFGKVWFEVFFRIVDLFCFKFLVVKLI